MRTILIALVILILAVIVRVAMVAIPASGMLTSLEADDLSQCQALEIAPGAEDITIHRETGRVFVSAAQRRPYHSGGFPSPDGDHSGNGIWSFMLDDPEGTLQMVSPDAPVGFSPHGIGLLEQDNGRDRLFVVNHSLQGYHSIEIFDLSADGILSWQETIRYPELISPNDVVAVGNRQFYATNDRHFMEGPAFMAASYLGLPLSSVSYYNGESGRLVAEGLSYANGINLSADGHSIYVAETLGRQVTVYERAGADGTLRRTGQIPVATAPDNIEIGTDGQLWIGAHPEIFKFTAHTRDESVIAPSQVVRVNPDTGAVTTELVAGNGEINASSVAAVSENQILIGAVLDSHILICPRD